jgi:hypothetical protein
LGGRLIWRFVKKEREFEMIDVFQPQTDQLIEPYLSKPLEEQDAVEVTRFKTKIFIETALIGRGNDLVWNDKLRLF